MEITGIGKQREFLVGREGLLSKLFTAVSKKLRAARAALKGVKGAERKTAEENIELLEGSQNQLRESLLDTRGTIGELAQTAIEAAACAERQLSRARWADARASARRAFSISASSERVCPHRSCRRARTCWVVSLPGSKSLGRRPQRLFDAAPGLAVVF